IEDITLGSARRVARLPRINQEDLEATRFEQLKERDPVDARRFHSDGGDAALRQPIGQAEEVGGAGAKGTNMRRQVGRMVGWRWWCQLGRDRDPVDGSMDVNAGRVRIRLTQRLGGRGLTEVLVLTRCHSDLGSGGEQEKEAASAGGVPA